MVFTRPTIGELIMSGVTFDERSAGRIADAVRVVEQSTGMNPYRRRREAGSGGGVTAAMPFKGSTSGSVITIAEGIIWMLGKAQYPITQATVTPGLGEGFVYVYLEKNYASMGVGYSTSEPLSIGEYFQFPIGTYVATDNSVVYTPRYTGDIYIVAPMI